MLFREKGEYDLFPHPFGDGRVASVDPCPNLADGGRKFSPEEDRMIRRPAVRPPPPFDRPVVDLTECRFAHVVLYPVPQVEHQVLVVAVFVGVSVNPRMRRGGQFDFHARIVQVDAIVSGRSLFALVVEPRAIAAVRLGFGSRFEPDGPDGRHEEDVSQIRTSRPAQVGVREADQARIAGVIAGTPVPSLGVGVGRELYEAERRGRSGEGVSVGVGADKGIYVVGRIAVGAAGGECQNAGG